MDTGSSPRIVSRLLAVSCMAAMVVAAFWMVASQNTSLFAQ